jgi:hypothetical protein
MEALLATTTHTQQQNWICAGTKGASTHSQLVANACLFVRLILTSHVFQL